MSKDLDRNRGLYMARDWLKRNDLLTTFVPDFLSEISHVYPGRGQEYVLAGFIEEIQRRLGNSEVELQNSFIKTFKDFGMVDATRWIMTAGKDYIKTLSQNDIEEVAERLYGIWHQEDKLPGYVKQLYLSSFKEEVELLIKYL